MTNKTFKELCKELKKAQKVRTRAIKEENTLLVEKANGFIDQIIIEMKKNKDFFNEITPVDIDNMAENDKQYDKLYNEYEIYYDKAASIENAYEDEITTDAHINKILGKKDKKVAIIAASIAGVLGITSLSGVVGYKLGHRNDKDEKDYTTEYTTEYTIKPIVEEVKDQYVDDDSEYDEKESVTVNFKNDSSEYKNTESNKATNNSISNNTNTNSNSNNSTVDSDNTSKKDKIKTTKDNNNNNNKNNYTFTDETKTIETENKESTPTANTENSNKQDYIIPAEEQHTEIVTEEEKPSVPENMPIEEDENDVIYYDINGNETTKEEADKSFEQSDINSNESPSIEVNTETNQAEELNVDNKFNSDDTKTTESSETAKEINNSNGKVVSEKTTEENGEKHTEIVIEEAAPEVPEDMPIEEDLITEYKALKAQLEETKALLEEKKDTNDNAMSLSL